MIKNYILIDPVPCLVSGISTYCENVKKNINIPNCEIIKRNIDENISLFCSRINNYLINNFIPSETVVEMPEAYSICKNIDSRFYTHVRLHCMHVFGEIIDGKKIDANILRCELESIVSADIISAPSLFIYKMTSFFCKIENIVIYPNPCNVYNFNNSSKDIDVLFIGRWQNIKGNFLLNDIINPLRDFKKVILTNNILAAQSLGDNKNTIVKQGVRDEVKDMLSKSKVVIIPSIFESYSMVYNEALENNCIVVGFSGNAIGEFDDNITCRCVNFCDYKNFSICIVEAIASYKTINNKIFETKINKIKSDFCIGVEKICSKNIVQNKNIINIDISLFVKNMQKSMGSELYRKLKRANRGGFMSFARKYKKLKQDPKKFWQDSFIVSLFKKSAQQKAPEDRKASHPVHEEVLMSSSVSDTLRIDPQRSPVELIQSLGTINFNMPLFKINKSVDINSNYNSCLFIYSSDEEKELIDSIVDGKFTFFKRRYCFRLKLDYTHNDYIYGSKELSLKFDNNTKMFLNNFKFVIMFNPKTNILQAMRFCAYNIKTVCIITDENHNIEKDNIDILIKNIKNDNICRDFRSVYVYTNKISLKNILIKAMTENIEKPYNMLIPVYNAFYYDESVHNINKEVDVYMDIESNAVDVKDFNDLIHSIKIKRLLVRESIFFAYKNILETSLSTGDFTQFLQYATYDGLRIEAHE